MRRGVMASARVAPPWSPLSVPGLISWLDADPAYLDTVDGLVETWRDRSGNGRHVSQASAAARPSVGASIWGSPALSFDANQVLSAGGGFTYPRPFTSIVVVSTRVIAGAPALALGQGALYMGRADTTSRLNAWFQGGQEIILSTSHSLGGVPIVMTATAATSPDAALFRVDGGRKSASASNHTGTIPMTDIIIGDINTTPGGGFIGEVLEVLVYDRALSTEEVSSVEQYLRAKHALAPNARWSSGLRLWLSAKDLRASAEGSPVSSIRNLSPVYPTWTHIQTDAAKQPTLTHTDGFPALHFEAGDLLVNNGTQRGYATTSSFFVVAKPGAADVMPLVGLNSGVNAAFWVDGYRPQMRVYGGNSEMVTGIEAATPGEWAVFSGRYATPATGGLLDARLNNGAITRGTPTTTINSSDRETIIGGSVTTGSYVGEIAEVIHYSIAVTDQEWDETVATLMKKYSIGGA